MSFMTTYKFNNRTNVLNFIDSGLKPAFNALNKFQQGLIIDTLSLLISLNNSDLWKHVTCFSDSIHGEYALTDDCVDLFSEFLDVLGAGFNASLSVYTNFSDFVYDEKDSIELYQYF
ncbi:hypothetical protein [Deinococcus hopiensis]|nr:hypothetical protein [Deinococcus hopiensis]